MRLEFTVAAIAELDSIHDHIAQQRPAAALHVSGQIKAAALRLSEFPFIGSAGVQQGTREWVVRGLPYILVYKVDEETDTLLVLNVFHGARDRPRGV